MTKIKLCGLSREEDIDTANALGPDYIGFVFAKKSRRAVSPETAGRLRARLSPGIRAVGVFVREDCRVVAELLDRGIIDLAQLHGGEDEAYVRTLRRLTDKPLIQAFRIGSSADLERALASGADDILLDNGAGGTGTAFDWSVLSGFGRPYFLAGCIREMQGRPCAGFIPLRWMSPAGLKPTGARTRQRCGHLSGRCAKHRERTGKHDKHQGTLWRPWRTVYSGDPDECGERAGTRL